MLGNCMMVQWGVQVCMSTTSCSGNAETGRKTPANCRGVLLAVHCCMHGKKAACSCNHLTLGNLHFTRRGATTSDTTSGWAVHAGAVVDAATNSLQGGHSETRTSHTCQRCVLIHNWVHGHLRVRVGAWANSVLAQQNAVSGMHAAWLLLPGYLDGGTHTSRCRPPQPQTP